MYTLREAVAIGVVVEGEKTEKLKKHLKKHAGKYAMLGAGALAAGSGYLGHEYNLKKARETDNRHDKTRLYNKADEIGVTGAVAGTGLAGAVAGLAGLEQVAKHWGRGKKTGEKEADKEK